MNAGYRLTIILMVSGMTGSLISCSTEQPETTAEQPEATAAQPEPTAGRTGVILTNAGAQRIRAQLGTVPLFDATVASVQAEVDAEIALGIDTPIPRDFSGGYTHERHKQNFLILQKAGVLFQILEDEKYAVYIRDMLFQYEAMYNDLPLHPQERSYARGKLFWQCLNDSNWLLYVSQAYDSIYEWLSAEERNTLESNLFRPFADFLSLENPQFFNRVHNHSTWGTAAVGMIGLVMGDDELVQRALYGVQGVGVTTGDKDDDGGFIIMEGQQPGFLSNLEEPFSPDGYYTEGPYYQRYAMYPFLIFAQGLHNARPDLNIFEHKDGVLLKAVNALLSLSDANGDFFPLNDAQKGMSYYSRELVTAVDIAYHVGGQDPQLLSIAERQGQVLLDDAGFAVAAAIRDGLAEEFEKTSVNFSDGADGSEGGLAVLRSGSEDLTLVFKYSAQGLSHGHYDKLSYSLYERGSEVVQDYGMARFVNIEQKGGGNYLAENGTWAKQTIAHNTITQDETSHFGGAYETGSLHHSELHFLDIENSDVQVVSAVERNAYPGTEMLRTMALIRHDGFEKPFLLDIFKVNSDDEHQYDLPLWFIGQVMQVNFDYDRQAVLQALGTGHGYQHLYLEGSGRPSSGNTKLLWMNNGSFYTSTTATESSDSLLFTRIGANDPDFNLRRDAALMIRRANVADTVFASVVEPHGHYSPVSEIAVNSNSNIAELSIAHDSSDYTAISIESLQGTSSIFIVSNTNAADSTQHQLQVGEIDYQWTGPFYFGEL